jgi:hypothetical protein
MKKKKKNFFGAELIDFIIFDAQGGSIDHSAIVVIY